MSLLSYSFFPRSMFDMDSWQSSSDALRPSTLELFDAFDDLDRLMSRNICWLNEPEKMIVSVPGVAQKYRITLDCQGFDPNSIKTQVNENKLVVNATEGEISPTEDYLFRELRKSFDLPKYVKSDKLVSFVTNSGQLVIEFPFKEMKANRIEIQPEISDQTDGSKRVEINAEIPDNIDPAKIAVTCKDRDLIIKADYKIEKDEGAKSRIHYYRRSTLPVNTDLNSIKCVLENNMLNITANLMNSLKKAVPIEYHQRQTQRVQESGQQTTQNQPNEACNHPNPEEKCKQDQQKPKREETCDHPNTEDKQQPNQEQQPIEYHQRQTQRVQESDQQTTQNQQNEACNHPNPEEKCSVTLHEQQQQPKQEQQPKREETSDHPNPEDKQQSKQEQQEQQPNQEKEKQRSCPTCQIPHY